MWIMCDHDAPHHVIFFGRLLLHLVLVRIFSSAPYSQNALRYTVNIPVNTHGIYEKGYIYFKMRKDESHLFNNAARLSRKCSTQLRVQFDVIRTA